MFLRPERVLISALGVAATVATYVGWRTFWFLTDDAFIAFRYASNSLLGHGYVWNPYPFYPVEGYTSFLWTFLLRQVWNLTGIEPPEAANWLSLGFGYITLALGTSILLRMNLPGRVGRLRLVWLAFVLSLTISNRTFLAWLSSGLETSLFNCVLTYWVFATVVARGRLRLAHLTTSCALVALTRPDGLLFVVASLPILIDALTYQRWCPHGPSPIGVASRVVACAPLLAIPLHLWFRYATYGQWVPNTYFAKVVSTWPESGTRYLLSFALEYGTWLWAVCALSWLGILVVQSACSRARARQTLLALHDRAPVVTVVSALVGHVLYYVLVVGGDHFEYRVFSHLPLLLALALVYTLARLVQRPTLIAVGLAAYLAVGLPIPWMHWLRTHERTVQEMRHRLRVRIASDFPRVLRPPVEVWDETQDWLIGHAVGSRHIEHKLFCERMLAIAPTRAEGERISWRDRPVLAMESVGVVGYALPHVAIIDMHGLNDRIVARTPPSKRILRKMAHERIPPQGYVRCFRPNVVVSKGRVSVKPRRRALTEPQIKRCDEVERWVGKRQK